MYYSAIGVLAVLILLIENLDILLKRNGAAAMPGWKVYRRFLLTALVYYLTDILWGVLETRKLSLPLFIDTSVYFVAMAVGVLFWTQYAITYLDEKSRFTGFFLHAGRVLAGLVALLTAVNIFTPILFEVDENCVYRGFAVRHGVLISQIVMLLMISVYALIAYIRHRNETERIKKYRTIALFGVIMASFLFAQLRYPYLPLYAIAYMLGISLLRTFIISDEKEAYRQKYEETAKIKRLEESFAALLNNMPALSFAKDAETGVYVACNQAFAEYANKKTPEQVIGLTDPEIFDEKTAKHFAEDDRMALSMDEPYIFYEDVPDAAGRHRQFQTTKLKYTDPNGRLCTLGICQDVTDLVRIQRENTTTKEAYEKAKKAGLMYTHIAQTLARGYTDLYYINVDTEEYVEYRTDNDEGRLFEKRRGWHFFDECRADAGKSVHPDDLRTFLRAMDRRRLLETLERSGSFIMTYRLLGEAGYTYVSMNISRMRDDGRFIVIGVTDVDEQMKQQRTAEQARDEHIAYTRLNALIGDFLCVYMVEPKTGRYREYSSTAGYETCLVPKEGEDFFGASRENARGIVHPDDLKRFLALFTQDSVLTEIEHNGIFALSYRLIIEGKPTFVQLKAAMVKEEDGVHLIVGINDIDSHMRQEQEYAKRLEQAQSKANIDALTGVKNKHAYLDAEEQLDRRIRERRSVPFAIVVLDVNDLKKVNDADGHQAGDDYLRSACKIICDIFKHSPVFRVGGDEFAVIVENDDYACLEELLGRLRDHNAEAVRTGGIVIACGMAKYGQDRNVAAVFERADQRMYENKSSLKAADDEDDEG